MRLCVGLIAPRYFTDRARPEFILCIDCVGCGHPVVEDHALWLRCFRPSFRYGSRSAQRSARTRWRVVSRRAGIGKPRLVYPRGTLAKRGCVDPRLDVVVLVHLDDVFARRPAEHPSDVLDEPACERDRRGQEQGTENGARRARPFQDR